LDFNFQDNKVSEPFIFKRHYMPETYDLVIFAKGMQASVLLSLAVDSGLKTAVVFGNDCSNSCTSPFVIVPWYRKPGLISFSKFTKVVHFLKNCASNLIIQTQVKHYLSIHLNHRLNSVVLNFFGISDLSVSKQKSPKNLNYASYKYSSDELTIAFLKYAAQKGADIYQYSTFVSAQFDESRNYKLSIYNKLTSSDFTISSKSYLVNPLIDLDKIKKTGISGSNETSFWFTYPAKETTITQTYIYENKDFKIVVIPWFNFVYFKISGFGVSNVDEALELIQKKLGDLQIDKNKIANSGVKENSLFLRKNAADQLIFHLDNQLISWTCPNIDNCFNHSRKRIIQIARLLNKGNPEKPLLQRIKLPGSDLGIEYHPLRLMELADEKYDLAKQILKDPSVFKRLFYRYGSDIELIIDKAYEYYNLDKNSAKAWLTAEIWYCKKYEMCLTPESFINTYSCLWMEGVSASDNYIRGLFDDINIQE